MVENLLLSINHLSDSFIADVYKTLRLDRGISYTSGTHTDVSPISLISHVSMPCYQKPPLQSRINHALYYYDNVEDVDVAGNVGD